MRLPRLRFTLGKAVALVALIAAGFGIFRAIVENQAQGEREPCHRALSQLALACAVIR